MNWPRPDPHRFRRLPGHVARQAAHDRRERRHLPLASRRRALMHLTPERSIEIQRLLGADIAMAFDECTPFPATEDEARASMELSMRWAERSKAAFGPRPGHALFGIVQGGVYPALRLALGRARSARSASTAMRWAGSRSARDRRRCSRCWTRPCRRCRRTRRAISWASASPRTSWARSRAASTCSIACCRPARAAPPRPSPAAARSICAMRGTCDDPRPLDAGCACAAPAAIFSRAYLHHLVRADEILGSMLLTEHNLRYYQDLMAGLRAAIAAGTLADFAQRLRRGAGQGRYRAALRDAHGRAPTTDP